MWSTSERIESESESVEQHEPAVPARAPGRSSRTQSLGPSIDRIADRVATVLQRRAAGDVNIARHADAAVERAAGASGEPLPESARTRFEASLGTDLSAVRVHTGAESAGASQALGATAYATGNDIHFAAGAYQPEDPFGMHLLAHEVAHTVQQAGATPRVQGKLIVSEPGDASEHEADRAADAMVAGQPAQVSAAGAGVQRATAEEPQLVAGDDQDRDADGQPDKATVPVRSCLGVCKPKGPSQANNWNLPEPLLVRMGADLPLVDVSAGATAISLSSPYGSAKLGSDGKFKITVKDGGLSAGTDGTRTEVGGKVGPVSGAVDDTGKVSGAVEVGPFKVGADSNGKASVTIAGVKMEYDHTAGTIATQFTPELSWGPATFKGAPIANGAKVTLELKLALCKDWSITISQEYLFTKTITPDEAQRALIETVVDPFFETVNGGAGSFSDLLRALGGQ